MQSYEDAYYICCTANKIALKKIFNNLKIK